MKEPSDQDKAVARRSRTVSVVIIGTALLWVAAQFLGAQFDVPAHWMVVLDLIALAALAWSMIVAVGIWRRRRSQMNGQMNGE